MKKTAVFIKEHQDGRKLVFDRSERSSRGPGRPNSADRLHHVFHFFQLPQTQLQLSSTGQPID